MILRLAELAVLAGLVLRFMTGQWPWERWPWILAGLGDGSEARRRERQARVLLGVRPAAVREEIIDAHRRLIAQVHPDRGGTSDAVFEANAARDLLLERLGPKNLG